MIISKKIAGSDFYEFFEEIEMMGIDGKPVQVLQSIGIYSKFDLNNKKTNELLMIEKLELSVLNHTVNINKIDDMLIQIENYNANTEA